VWGVLVQSTLNSAPHITNILQIRAEKMSENQETNIIEFPQAGVSDEDFNIFMNAFLGNYKGGGYNPE